MNQLDKTIIRNLVMHYFRVSELTGEPTSNLDITDDGVVNFRGNISYDGLGGSLQELPVQFGEIGGNFLCAAAGLTTLLGSPHKVGNTFDCSANKLNSFQYGPIDVGGSFTCRNNHSHIPNLIGVPNFCDQLDVTNRIGGIGLESLDGLPSPANVNHINISIKINDCPILRLLKYSSFNIISNSELNQIMHKYMNQRPLRPAILQCQKELIDAGFEGNATL